MDIRMKASGMQMIMGKSLKAWGAVFSVFLFVAAGFQPAVEAQTIPSATVFKTTTLTNINGNAGHIAANNAGDAFYVSQTDNTAYWLPRGTTTPIPLLTGLSGGRSVYVDASNNVYIPSNYSGTISEIPYVNGTYVTNSARTSLTACTSTTPAAPCNQFGNGGAGVSYYYQATDLGFDGSGNAYIADEYDNDATPVNSSDAIEVFSVTGVTYAATLLINNLPHTSNSQIAVDTKGDVYYADGTNLYTVPAGAKAISTFGTGLKTPVGVSLDKYGNLYVTDSGLNQIIEFPALNGVAQTNTQFVFDPVYSANGVGFDNLGNMFYTAYTTQTVLNTARINSFNLGTAAIGTATSATPTTLTVVFNTAQTVAAITLAGATSGFSYTAGTCAPGAYAAAQTCTFNVNYTPTAVGLQKGAVVLTNASNAVIATAELSGSGLGAAQTSDPATVSTIGSGFVSPQGIAVDGSKNVYIADPGKNAVLEYVAGTGTGISLGSGLSKPSSVAVDNAGNVYIGDSGNGRVVEVPSIAGVATTTAQSVVLTGLGSSLALASDSHGLLYVADTNNNKVYQLGTLNGAPNASALSMMKLAATSVAPSALATDATGNLFVADTTANTITEIAYYGKAQTNIGTGYLHPSGLAVDASSSLYVADPGNLRLIKIPFETPTYNPNDQYSVGPQFTLAAGVTIPYGVAVDNSGNLYVIDSQDATAKLLNRQQGTLALGNSNVAVTTAQQNVYIADAGNQTLTLANPDYTATPSPAFTVTSPSTGGCTNSESLSPGFSCILQATFTPPAVGNYTETLSFAGNNAANAATPSIMLTGSGLTLASTTLTLQQTSPAGTAAFGQTVVVTATIASPTAGTPSGDIIVYVDGNFYSVVKVSGTATAININGLLGGTHNIAASYTGDNTFAPSSGNLTIMVTKASSTTTVAGVMGQVSMYPTSAAPGTNITLNATVVPNATAAPQGSVTFTSGGKTLGMAPVQVVSGSYVATISTAALPLGSNTVTATYSGDPNYFPSSGTLLIVISPPNFLLSPATQSITATPQSQATAQFQVASLSNFAGMTVLTCAGLPANTNCGFNPNGFPLQALNQLTAQVTNMAGAVIVYPTYGPSPVSMVITTGTTPPVPQPPINASIHIPGLHGSVPFSLAFLGLTPFALLLRRRKAKSLNKSIRLLSLLVLLGVSVTAFSGCGSNLIGNTPKGTYQVTVTATATDTTYPAPTAADPLPSNCSYMPTGATGVTCAQSVQVTLVVQ